MACAILLVLALLWLGAPLWRQKAPDGDGSNPSLQASNIEALQAQLIEAEQELAAGRLEQATFEETERELATRMVEETKASEAAASTASPQPVLFVIVALFIAALTVGLYLDLGKPNLVVSGTTNAAVEHSEAEAFDPQVATARVEVLRKQLEINAQDPTSWVELARLERRLGDTSAATRSYQHAVMLAQDDTQKTELQLEMVETFAQHAEQNQTAIPPMALNIANDVLARHGEHPRALWYGAMLAESAGQRPLAIARVKKLLSLNPPEQIRRALEQQLSAWQAQSLPRQSAEPASQAALGENSPQEAAANSRELSIDVDIPSGIDVGNTNMATLFVYARPADGSRMPLAVWRHESPIFPLQATLNDSMAMMPGTKLASYDQLEIVARISFTGNAISQPGDWFGTATITKEQNELSIAIDQMVE